MKVHPLHYLTLTVGRIVEKDIYSSGHELTTDIAQHFQVPEYLFSDMYRRSNGFFKFQEYGKSGENLEYCTSMRRDLTSFPDLSTDSWFRFLVKVCPSSQTQAIHYVWFEMTFFSSWTPTKCSMLCIGVPPGFVDVLETSISHISTGVIPSDPFSLHIPLIESMISLQNSSVWSIRDIVRSTEKVSLFPGHGQS